MVACTCGGGGGQVHEGQCLIAVAMLKLGYFLRQTAN
jgi:hypothetical protein